MEVHTTTLVFNEVYSEQQQILQAFQSVDKITVHNLQEHDLIAIFSEDYAESLSEADKSVLYVADKIDACVLSSDKKLRNCDKKKGIEYHGMIWIFDRLVEKSILIKKEATHKLKHLTSINFVFQNNPQLTEEIEKRLNLWQ